MLDPLDTVAGAPLHHVTVPVPGSVPVSIAGDVRNVVVPSLTPNWNTRFGVPPTARDTVAHTLNTVQRSCAGTVTVNGVFAATAAATTTRNATRQKIRQASLQASNVHAVASPAPTYVITYVAMHGVRPTSSANTVD